MDKISIFLTNIPKEVTVIRYYESNNNNYFIFSENEEDEGGYVKLYANKISIVAGTVNAVNIVDENEWTMVKEEIKTIIKSNNEGRSAVKDLNFNDLRNIAVNDSRIFKLNKQLADILAANKQASAEEDPLAVRRPIPPASEISPVADIPAPDVFGVPVAPVIPTPSLYGEPTVASPFEPQMAAPVSSSSDEYKRLYEEEKERVQGLTIELTDLKSKLDTIKNMLDN